jgi:hypothetical protein
MAIVTSSLMSDHQNYVRLCSLLKMAKLACLADYAGGQFCTCLSCQRGRNLVPFFDKFALNLLRTKISLDGLLTSTLHTSPTRMNHAMVADSSIWLLALYLPFSVLIFCGQFCTLVKKFTNTFFHLKSTK